MIPYGKHYIDDSDIEAVADVLKNGMLTQGPKIQEFEEKVAEYVGANFAVAVSSATAALHIACTVAGIKKGSSAVTSANTFVASSNAILYCQGSPLFTDIDPYSLGMSVSSLEKILKENSSVRAVIPVHFAGLAKNMQEIQSLCKSKKITIIEDAAHALGSSYECGHKVGSCKYSDLTCFSFHPVKGVTTGEGGIITTNCSKMYKLMLKLRSHGICKGNFDYPGVSSSHTDVLFKPEEAYDCNVLNPWYYEMQELGFNYRMTDIQAALGISQMNKINKFINRRRKIAYSYDKWFKDSKLIEIQQNENRSIHSLHLYTIKIDFRELGVTRRNFMEELISFGIGSQVHYIPVPFHPYYESLGFDIKNYPNALDYYNKALSIPIFYSLTDDDVEFVAKSIINLVEKISK